MNANAVNIMEVSSGCILQEVYLTNFALNLA